MAMNQAESDLWKKLSCYSFDDPQSPFRFSARLARENRWTKEFTQAVLEEYRRFLFLACVCDHQVTPSIEVDEAWHLHMIYTRSYWDDLCLKTLGKPVHHGPTRGGRSEDLRYVEQYQKTLESYAKYFGEVPPGKIWPDASVRFRRDFNAVHVDISRNWVIRKPRWFVELNYNLRHVRIHLARIYPGQRKAQAWPILILLIYLFVGLLGLSASVEPQMKFAAIVNPVTRFDAGTFLTFYPIFGVMLLTVTYFSQRYLLITDDLRQLKLDDESAETIAILKEKVGTSNRLALLSLSRLLSEKKIDYDLFEIQDGSAKTIKTYKIVENTEPPSRAIDKLVFRVIQKFRAENKSLSDDELIAVVNNSSEMQQLQDEINNRKLMTFSDNYWIARFFGFLLFLLFIGVGLSRAMIGLQRHRPIGYLMIEIVAFLIPFFILNRNSRFTNNYTSGGVLISELPYLIEKNRNEFDSENKNKGENYWKSVAAFGLGSIPVTERFAELINRYTPPDSSSSESFYRDSFSSSCGSSDSGGSSCGGGGCGGCGGGGD